MNMPQFTAEASLYNGSTRYRATAKTAAYNGLVHQASSDVISDPGGSSLPRLGPWFDLNPKIPCLRQTCFFYDPNEPWKCWPGALVTSLGTLVGGVCV
jgi:hypothetical protein